MPLPFGLVVKNGTKTFALSGSPGDRDRRHQSKIIETTALDGTLTPVACAEVRLHVPGSNTGPGVR